MAEAPNSGQSLSLRREAETPQDAAWIQTFTGKRFWPTSPRAEDVCIEDIAHALSLKCRFSGHSQTFYSVAQHCVLASAHCDDPQWALMHDATEAYLPDVARPVKPFLAGFVELEEHLMSVIGSVFGLAMPIPACVHEVDLVMLATERRDLMGGGPQVWSDIVNVEPLGESIVPWSPAEAENEFLSRFKDVFRDSDLSIHESRRHVSS